MEGEGFEPSKAEPSDLQSDPVDRLGIPPSGKPRTIEPASRPVKQFRNLFFENLICLPDLRAGGRSEGGSGPRGGDNPAFDQAEQEA